MYLSVAARNNEKRHISMRPDADVELALDWKSLQKRLDDFCASLGSERLEGEGLKKLSIKPLQEAVAKLFQHTYQVQRVELMRFEPAYAPTRERCGVWIKEPSPATGQLTLLFRPYSRITIEMALRFDPPSALPRVLGDMQDIANKELQPPPEETPAKPSRERTTEAHQIELIQSAATPLCSAEPDVVMLIAVHTLLCAGKIKPKKVSRAKSSRLISIALRPIFQTERTADAVIARLAKAGYLLCESRNTKMTHSTLLSLTPSAKEKLQRLGFEIK